MGLLSLFIDNLLVIFVRTFVVDTISGNHNPMLCHLCVTWENLPEALIDKSVKNFTK